MVSGQHEDQWAVSSGQWAVGVFNGSGAVLMTFLGGEFARATVWLPLLPLATGHWPLATAHWHAA